MIGWTKMEFELSLPPEKLRQRFLALEHPEDVADMLEVSFAQLTYLLFIAPREHKYKTFTISKRSGGLRNISAPTSSLKIIQQKLNQVLQVVYTPKQPVHGFVSGKSIVTNAAVHAGQSFVFNLDLQDFFPSINFGRVRGLFMGNPYDLPPAVATILAQICCHENGLPQGAPTSPAVANMICGQLDEQLQALARRHGCRYTRYADDITFSSSRIIFPPTIARFEYNTKYKKTAWLVGVELRERIKKNGFAINPEKVRMQTKNQHQEVTGLVTNEFPNVSRRYVRQIRAMLHAWEKYGSKAAHREYYDQYNPGSRGPYKSQPSFKQIVRGKIEFLGMVRSRDDPVYQRFQQHYQRLTSRPVEEVRELMPPVVAQTPKIPQFSHWIETLPFPLASILQLYDAEDNEKERYGILLHFFEAWAEFWAVILLSGFDQDKTIFDDMRKKIVRAFRNRPRLAEADFGTWKIIIEVLTAKIRKIQKQSDASETLLRLFKTTADNPIMQVLCSKRLVDTVNGAISIRNRRYHGGILAGKALEYNHNELKKHLDTIMDVFGEHWSNYRLISPLEGYYESGYHDFRIQRVIGSRTPFKKARQTLEYALDKNKLFMADPNGQKALELWPLVCLGPSPETVRNAFYFYNRWEQDNKVRWVSYHFDDQPEVVIESFDVIGILKMFSVDQ
jgi:RNA-directed DNA polymerase